MASPTPAATEPGVRAGECGRGDSGKGVQPRAPSWERSGAGADQGAQPAEVRAPRQRQQKKMRASERGSERQGERGRRGEGGRGRGWSAGSTKGRGDRSRSARRLRPQPHSGRRQPSPASLRCKCGPSALRFRRPFKERAPGSPPPLLPRPAPPLPEAWGSQRAPPPSTPAPWSAPPPAAPHWRPLLEAPFLPSSRGAGVSWLIEPQGFS